MINHCKYFATKRYSDINAYCVKCSEIYWNVLTEFKLSTKADSELGTHDAICVNTSLRHWREGKKSTHHAVSGFFQNDLSGDATKKCGNSRHLPPCYPLPHLTSPVSRHPSPVSYLPSPVSCLSSLVSRLPSPVSRLSSLVSLLSSLVSRLSSHVSLLPSLVSPLLNPPPLLTPFPMKY